MTGYMVMDEIDIEVGAKVPDEPVVAHNSALWHFGDRVGAVLGLMMLMIALIAAFPIFVCVFIRVKNLEYKKTNASYIRLRNARNTVIATILIGLWYFGAFMLLRYIANLR